MPENYFRVTAAAQTCRLDIWLLPDSQRLTAGQACIFGSRDDGQRQNSVCHTAAQDTGNSNGKNKAGKR